MVFFSFFWRERKEGAMLARCVKKTPKQKPCTHTYGALALSKYKKNTLCIPLELDCFYKKTEEEKSTQLDDLSPHAVV
jgi:hypothetical protein